MKFITAINVGAVTGVGQNYYASLLRLLSEPGVICWYHRINHRTNSVTMVIVPHLLNDNRHWRSNCPRVGLSTAQDSVSLHAAMLTPCSGPGDANETSEDTPTAAMLQVDGTGLVRQRWDEERIGA